MTAGIRMEAPIYPELKNNYNAKFADLKFKMADGSEVSYTTDQLPDAPVTISPRVGFNWDVLGNQKVVLRGGTGYFIGRLPFVWLVSAVSNSGCGQYQYSYIQGDAKSLPTFGETSLLGIHQVHVQMAWVLDCVKNSLFGNLVEDNTVCLLLIQSQYFAKVPADGFSLAVLIGC